MQLNFKAKYIYIYGYTEKMDDNNFKLLLPKQYHNFLFFEF